MQADYVFTMPDGIMGHHSRPVVTLLRDQDDNLKHQELKAHVYSGDYFSLLATRLDEISQTLASEEPANIALQHIVNDLLYLQRYYKVTKKTN